MSWFLLLVLRFVFSDLLSEQYIGSHRKGNMTLKTIAVTCKEGEINEAFIYFLRNLSRLGSRMLTGV